MPNPLDGADTSALELGGVPGQAVDAIVDGTGRGAQSAEYAGRMLIVFDPSDPFAYVYASTSSRWNGYGEGSYFGVGRSANGHIPFQPDLPWDKLEPFDDGHRIFVGPVNFDNLGPFGGFRIDGTAVLHDGRAALRDAAFTAAVTTDPSHLLESTAAVRIGVNGTASFELNVPHLDELELELGRASASLEVDMGKRRAYAAVQGVVGLDGQDAIDAATGAGVPGTEFLPATFPLVPEDRLEARVYADLARDAADFELGLSGRFGVRTPEGSAAIEGELQATPERLGLTGRVGSPNEGLAVSYAFRADGHEMRAELETGLARAVGASVLAGVDAELDAIANAADDLERAVGAYEFEASLRGLRTALPPALRAAKRTARGVPDKVRGRVHTEIVNWIKARRWLDVVAPEQSIARGVAAVAKREAESRVRTIVRTLDSLERELARGDDASARSALKRALDLAYANRTYSRRFGARFTFAGKTYTPFSRTFTYTVIPNAWAAKIRDARAAVDRIPATSRAMVSAQAVVDALPTEEVIAAVRARVGRGVAALPSVGAVGYTVTRGRHAGYVEIDGRRVAANFNVLDPQAVRRGAVDLVVDRLL